MKKSATIFFTLLFCKATITLWAQNLVPNPGFESYSNTFCGVQTATDFQGILIDWVNPNQSSPQVFFTNIDESCFNHQPFSTYSGPLGIKGSQEPRSGEVMVGLWLFTIPSLNQRQYVQAELSSAMVAGNTYAVEFYVSLADFMEFSIDRIGAYLSVDPLSSDNTGPLNFTPQVAASTFVDDVSNWVVISDTIVAQANYRHITIGNFYDDDATNTMTNPSSSGEPGTYGAFYFVDDVSVEEITTLATDDSRDAQYKIYPTITSDLVNIEIPIDSRVDIFSSHGERVYTREMSRGSDKIDISAFPKGVYIISIQNEIEKVTRRVVK